MSKRSMKMIFSQSSVIGLGLLCFIHAQEVTVPVPGYMRAKLKNEIKALVFYCYRMDCHAWRWTQSCHS